MRFFLAVAHVGEEGPVSNIYDSLELLKVSRFVHGVRCADDYALVNVLARSQMPLMPALSVIWKRAIYTVG